ncbi:TPA: DUF4785 family protein [Legionella pneumophila]|nr:DUF4785 domain-containing protein [Legionella pneumophila]HAT8591746.1 DUF4785 family protein [Legionella pneumophila]HCR5121100.1 DUF4785 family protein [Legionella pneumophila]HCR5124014.1 DUF4785 family protein [Legionella pneumophila]HCR5127676.1 DUF4785 family protein [Legionella pneumophila]HCR5130741.1 DUF4785 family protein [Legionella pneumophila]
MKTAHLIWISAFCIAQAHAFTLPRQPTKSYECENCSQLSHENLHDKWEITNEPLNNNISNVRRSYGYKERISLEQLQRGVIISTLAPGAVVRITPLQNKSIPELLIKTPKNQLLPLKEASSLYNQDDEVGNNPLAITKHQAMLQIKPELGYGKFILKSKDITNKNADTYMISVLDKFSITYLEVETDSLHYQYGDKLKATISLHNDITEYDVNDVDARLVGPKGQVISLNLTKLKSNVFEGTATLDSELNDRGENWYLETDVQTEYGQEIIRRSGHTAFSYSIPSASLMNVKKLSSKPLTFVVTVDVATASRYALQSVLFQKNGKGEARPIQTSQRAQWLEPGKHVLQFTFDNHNQLSDDNLYLGYLRLIDYGQLKTVYQYNQPVKLSQLVD